jgi:hypothetical protein
MQDGAIVGTEDVGVLVATALARRVMDAIPFPISIRIPSARAEQEGDGELGEADLEFTPIRTEGEDDLPELSEINDTFASGISEMVQRVREGTVDESSADPAQLKALKALAAVLDANPDKAAFYQANPGDIDAALTELVSKRWVDVNVEWVKVEIERPLLTLSNPILLSNMVVHVQAKVKACIKVLGKKFCATVTSPRLRLEARQARLELGSSGAKVTALPQFKDLDIVLKIKIWKWTVKVTVGITGLVNKQLRKQGPIQLLDLSAFEQTIPYSTKRVTFESFEFPADPKGLLARASMKVA